MLTYLKLAFIMIISDLKGHVYTRLAVQQVDMSHFLKCSKVLRKWSKVN